MKNILTACLALAPAAAATAAADRPNVILVLADDQGYGDFSCHGNPVLKTPALDRLRAESVSFSDFHVAPLSTPTRGQLMTGLDAMHNKASTVLSGCCMMRRDIPVMPELFAANGYRTGIFGKWHLGDNFPDRPMDRGFEKCVWIKGWGLRSEAEFDNDYRAARYLDGTDEVQTGGYCTDMWFSEAMEWMGEMAGRGEPFFTYLALNAPHGPFDAPEKDRLKYEGLVEAPVDSFFGMISNIDDNMAALDGWLAANGLRGNTIVIYINDNGTAAGENVWNAGMRGKKGSVYDGGHRAACFLRWPDGGLAAPREAAYTSHSQDLLPTLAGLLGLDTGDADGFDGIDLTPALRGEEERLPERMLVVQQGNHAEPVKYNSCVMYGRWRLVGRGELYDIKADPGQVANVAAKHPAVAGKMRRHYEEWWAGVDAGRGNYLPLILDAPDGEPVTLTSADWIEGGPNTQWKIAAADEMPEGGTWVVESAGGRYIAELSRWPFHTGLAVSWGGAMKSVAGSQLRRGMAIPVAGGVLTVGGAEIRLAGGADDPFLTAEVNLPAGQSRIRGCFTDSSGKPVCGGYYLRLRRAE